MIDLEARARTLNEQAVTPRLPVELVLKRGHRIRVRRRVAAVVVAGSLLVVGLAGAAMHSTGTTKHLVVTGSTTQPRPTATASAPPHAVPAPKQFIAHLEQGGSARPGKVVIIDTATGSTIRSIGADYDPYLSNGFAIARAAGVALWTRLNEPAQTLELVETPLTGGAARVMTSSGFLDGPLPEQRSAPLLTAVDAAGARLWMNGNAIVDLSTGKQQRVQAPPVETGWSWDTASWMPDGHELFMVEGQDLPRTCYTDIGPALGPPRTTPAECITTPATRSSRTRGLVYDLSDPNGGWRVTATPDRPEGWWGLRILGAGRLPSTVVAVGNFAPTTTGAASTLMTVDVNTGAIVDQLKLPADANVLSVDASGTNILFTTNRRLERVSLADPKLVILRRQVAEAAW